MPPGPHWTNQRERHRAQNATARAQQHSSALWSPVRDEEAAGSNPVTPTRHSRRPEARTRNGEDLSCCAGTPKGTLRERHRACSAARKRPGPSSGRRGRRVQSLSPRPFPQVADLRERHFMRRCSIPSDRHRGLEGTKRSRGHRDGQREHPAAQHDAADHAAEQGPFRAP
jgi:hypothetical protein